MNTTESKPEETTEVQKDQTETPLESLASICTVLAVGLFVMTFIFQNFEIPSGSMEKTLLIGDHVLVDRTSFAPPTKWAPFVHYRDIRHGDVIVFYKPNPETPDLFLVKRAIGIPGDHIHLHNGIVYLNGVAQNEPEAGKPVDDGNPQHAFDAYRDDFPSVPPSSDGDSARRHHRKLGARSSQSHPKRRPCGSSRDGICNGRQPHREPGWTLLGIRS